MSLSTRVTNSIKSEISRLEKQREKLREQLFLLESKIDGLSGDILRLQKHIGEDPRVDTQNMAAKEKHHAA